jgi:uncharacterized membrane protein YkgB
MSSQERETREWHVAEWSPLAWLETGIKAIALMLGIVAAVRALVGGGLAFPSGFRLAQLIVQGLLSLGLIAAIFDRLAEREIVAMVFVIINSVGHWGMLLALASQVGPDRLLLGFAGLMLLGDLVKLGFLMTHPEFTVRDTPRAALYGLTLFYVVGYVLILIFELLR